MGNSLDGIRRLDLSNNGFGPNGAQSLVDPIRDLKTLEVLKLSSNGFGYNGAQNLVSACRALPDLQSLDLSPESVLWTSHSTSDEIARSTTTSTSYTRNKDIVNKVSEVSKEKEIQGSGEDDPAKNEHQGPGEDDSVNKKEENQGAGEVVPVDS